MSYIVLFDYWFIMQWSNSPIRVLLVDDEKAQMELTRVALLDADTMLDITTVELPSNAIRMIEEHEFDCIVSDYKMSEMNGLEFCHKIKETSDIPFIIYTGRGSDEVAFAAFEAGVNDYVRKEKELAHYGVLARRIRHTVEKHKSDKALIEREDQIIGIFESITDGFVSLDKDWKYTYVNNAAEKSLKTAKENLIGKVVWDYWPEPPDEFKDALTEAVNTYTPKKAEFYYPFLNSWFQVNAYPSDAGINVYFQDVTEKKRTEQELERERRVLKGVLENSSAMLAYFDTGFNFVAVNPAYAEASGHSVEDLVGRNHFDLFPNTENETIFMQVRDSGEATMFLDKPFEYIDQPWRGVTYWNWSLAPVKDSSGVVHGLVLSLMETTERKRAEDLLRNANEELAAANEELAAANEELAAANEELATANEDLAAKEEEVAAYLNEVVELNRINLEYSSKLEELVEERTAQLRENEFRLRGFMDSATDAFFIYDSDLKLLDLNPAALSLYARGTKREDLIGRKMIEVAHGIEKTARYEVYKRTLKTGEPYYENDFPVIPSLGEGWASIRAFKMGENLGIIWRDTTARVMAEARLKESEAKLRLFMDSANDGFAIYDKDLNLVEVNNVVVARFPSMSREEVLGRNITELYPGIEDTVFLLRVPYGT